MLNYIIMVLAKARSQEILTPSLHSKLHHHLGLVERRFRPDSFRCAGGQINCHPKNLLCWKAAKGLQAGWLKPRIAILVAQQLNSRQRRIFFCEIRHSQHILGFFQRNCRGGGLSGWENFTRIGVARYGVDAACLLLPLCRCVIAASEGKHMADTNGR